MRITRVRARLLLCAAILVLLPQAAVSAVDFDACTRCGPGMILSPQSLDFGAQKVHTTTTQEISIRSVGNIPLKIKGISKGSKIFSQTNSCPKTLQKDHFCEILVSFTPSAARAYAGKIKLTTNAGNAVIPLTGTGVAP